MRRAQAILIRFGPDERHCKIQLGSGRKTPPFDETRRLPKMFVAQHGQPLNAPIAAAPVPAVSLPLNAG
jgi:hypothetical protein